MAVEPLANVVADYACCDGQNEGNGSVHMYFTSFPHHGTERISKKYFTTNCVEYLYSVFVVLGVAFNGPFLFFRNQVDKIFFAEYTAGKEASPFESANTEGHTNPADLCTFLATLRVGVLAGKTTAAAVRGGTASEHQCICQDHQAA